MADIVGWVPEEKPKARPKAEPKPKPEKPKE